MFRIFGKGCQHLCDSFLADVAYIFALLAGVASSSHIAGATFVLQGAFVGACAFVIFAHRRGNCCLTLQEYLGVFSTDQLAEKTCRRKIVCIIKAERFKVKG